jgi:hypothetical protein
VPAPEASLLCTASCDPGLLTLDLLA